MTLLDSAPPTPRRVGRPPRLPVPATAGRWLVLAAALVCAACGLVYELALTAIGGSLGGDPVTETSLVLSVMVFAMGLGSLAAKPLGRRPAGSFAVVETVLGVLGGLSVTAVQTWQQHLGGHRTPLVLVAAVLGLLIGAEVPLLMTLVQRIRRQEAADAMADLNAADYTGALAGGLLFPFLLLPALGPARTTIVAGAVNLATGTLLVLWLFCSELQRPSRVRLAVAAVVALLLLGAAAVHAPDQPPTQRSATSTPTSSSRTATAAPPG